MDRELTQKERAGIRRRRMLPFILSGVLVIVGIGLLLSLMRSSVNREDVMLATVDTGTIQTSVTGSGSVVPAFEEIINSPIASRVMEVYCKAGDTVNVGTPLLRLDLQSTETELNKLYDQIQMKRYEFDQQRINNDTHLNDLAMQIKVKEMSVNRLAVEVRNEHYLDSLGSGTGDRVREAELAYNTGRLELEQMRQRLVNERQVSDATMKVKNLDISIAEKNLGEMRRTLDDARVLAPRKATLTFINDQIGQKISAGEQIAIISDLSHFKVEGELPDSYADRIAVGSKAMVRIGRDRIPGMVSNVTTLSRNGVISFSVRLDDDADTRLRSGLKVDVYVMCDVMDDVIRIPNASFYVGPGLYQVFVKDGEDKLVRRDIRLGEGNYEYVEVIDGLKPGDCIVTNDMSKFMKNESIKLK